jgi:adenylyltransferase/sulfurtransferase
MSVQISVPTALRGYTESKAVVAVDGATVKEALDALTERYPALARHLRDASGKLRTFLNVYLNDEDIRYLPERDATALRDGDNLIIVPSIAGGVT